MVHFSISDIDEDETYVLEIGGRRLAEGSGNDAEEVAGQFTMPDLGGGERKVTVEAEIGDRDDRDDTKTVKRKLRYLGAPAPAPAIAAPPPVQAAPIPAAPPPAAVTPAPTQALTAPEAPASRATADRTRSKRAPRRARKRRTTERRPVESRRDASPVKRAKTKSGKVNAKPKRKRDRARTAPLFDGVPESSRSSAAPGRSNGSSGLNAVAPPTALTRAATDGAYAGPAAAVLVPALLGLAALALVGTALLRSRRRPR